MVRRRNLPDHGKTQAEKWQQVVSTVDSSFRERMSPSLKLLYRSFLLDVASRHREQFLYNMYQMERNAIERGSRDYWTFRPKQVDSVRAASQEGDLADLAAIPGGLGAIPVPVAEYE